MTKKRLAGIGCFLLFLIISSHLNAQQKKVTGTVKDEKGNAPAGATISAKGTSVTGISDDKSNYSIDLPEKAKTLVFTYVGMQPEEIEVGSSGIFNSNLAALPFLI